MKHILKFGCFGVATALALATAQIAQALPSNEIEITYYKTAAKTVEVGYRLLSCSGHLVRTGRTSPFRDRTVSRCQVSKPPKTPTLPCDFLQNGCPNLPGEKPIGGGMLPKVPDHLTQARSIE